MKFKIYRGKLYIPVLLLIVLFISSCGEMIPKEEVPKGVVFPDVEYSKVIAYHFEDLEGGYIIDENGELNSTVKKQKELSENEIERFLETMNNKNSYGGIYTRCFKPRLGVVFYDAAAKPVAQVSICFQCNQQMSTPLIKAHLEASAGTHGYSEEGFRDLTTLCRKLGFGQCGE